MPLEIEMKFPGVDLTQVRDRLAMLGAECGRPYLERNVVFDTPDRRLLKAGCLLRVRECEGADWKSGLLTFKRPAPGKSPSGCKRQEETESGLTNPQSVSTILAMLGYPAAFAYDKTRAVCRLDGVEICLDRLPFGEAGDDLYPVVELEGDETAIAAVTRRLDLPQDCASAANYHELNRQWRAGRGLLPRDGFAFSPADLEKIRQELGLLPQRMP